MPQKTAKEKPNKAEEEEQEKQEEQGRKQAPKQMTRDELEALREKLQNKYHS